jgi:hypothetical protein
MRNRSVARSDRSRKPIQPAGRNTVVSQPCRSLDAAVSQSRVFRRRRKSFEHKVLRRPVTLVTLVTMNRGPFQARRPERRDAGILGLDPIELPAGDKRCHARRRDRARFFTATPRCGSPAGLEVAKHQSKTPNTRWVRERRDLLQSCQRLRLNHPWTPASARRQITRRQRPVIG